MIPHFLVTPKVDTSLNLSLNYIFSVYFFLHFCDTHRRLLRLLLYFRAYPQGNSMLPHFLVATFLFHQTYFSSQPFSKPSHLLRLIHTHTWTFSYPPIPLPNLSDFLGI